jgi:hypothetical protein
MMKFKSFGYSKGSRISYIKSIADDDLSVKPIEYLSTGLGYLSM